MTPTEYRAALTRLGLNQTTAARVIGVAPRTSRAWACGEAGVPEPVERLLRAFEAHPELMGWVGKRVAPNAQKRDDAA